MAGASGVAGGSAVVSRMRRWFELTLPAVTAAVDGAGGGAWVVGSDGEPTSGGRGDLRRGRPVAGWASSKR
jgi:hypothetical protein